MNYEESIAYLEAAASFGIKPGLERIEAILERLDHPEKAYKVIHVTGTNGKGSVVAMITSVLENATLKVGRYISPHLIDYTERIHIAGYDIPKEDFAKAATVVREAAEKAIADGVEAPTEFELLTAMAFWYFKEQKVDYAVMEVGMGGLYDSTNVIIPVVSVITNVAMDHEKYLGKNLEEIAHQKAGIIKEGIPVVTAAQHVPLKQLKKKRMIRKRAFISMEETLRSIPAVSTVMDRSSSSSARTCPRNLKTVFSSCPSSARIRQSMPLSRPWRSRSS